MAAPTMQALFPHGQGKTLTGFELLSAFLSGFMKRLKSRSFVEGKWVRRNKVTVTHAAKN